MFQHQDLQERRLDLHFTRDTFDAHLNFDQDIIRECGASNIS